MNRLTLAIVLALSLYFVGCKTDVDLNAPYKSTTVVFGLIDPLSDMQWIKINKTFIGSGNNLDYALIRDSSEYKWDEFDSLNIERIYNGTVLERFNIKDTLVSNKEVNGIFYGPEQTLYYVNIPFSSISSQGHTYEECQYRLAIYFHSRPDVFSTTDVVQPRNAYITQPSGNSFVSLATSHSGFAINYNENSTVSWNPATNATHYELTLRLNYKDSIISTGEATPRYIDYKIGTKEADPSSNTELDIKFGGEGFYAYLGANLIKSQDIHRILGRWDATQGKTRCFDIHMAMGNEALKNYVDVNSPVTGIIQERPTWTNIENGLGLFASRSVFKQENMFIRSSNNDTGIFAMVNSPYTIELNFCEPNPNSSTYSCQ